MRDKRVWRFIYAWAFLSRIPCEPISLVPRGSRRIRFCHSRSSAIARVADLRGSWDRAFPDHLPD